MRNLLATIQGKAIIEVGGLCITTRHGVTFQSESLLDCIRFLSTKDTHNK